VGTGAVGAARQGTSASLSADGTTIIVGGVNDNVIAGAAWVFARNGGVWTQQGTKLVGTGTVGAAQQGFRVSLSGDGNWAIVGGYVDNSNTGAAWMYINAQPGIGSVKDLPFDQGGTAVVSWNRSRGDEPPSALVTQYWMWRGIRVSSAPGNATVLARGEYTGKIANNEATALMFMSTRLPEGNRQLAGDIYWQYITSVPSHGLAHYSYACPTLADSTPQGIPWRYFFITAATDNPDIYWDSPADSGYSVDNLAPRTPANAMLASLANGRVRLSWTLDRTDPDVGHYAVYRSATTGFSVADSTRLHISTDSTIVDSSTVTGNQYYYRITTVDVHGNESTPTAELGIKVTALPGVSAVNAPDEFVLGQNYPNPFNPSTAIRYGLPNRSHVVLTVFNALGQQIAQLINADMEAGYHDVKFDGKDLSSGVYFYRIEAGDPSLLPGQKFVQVRKLLLIR
jgi:hypothetical protein